jgi:hypothetical protein
MSLSKDLLRVLKENQKTGFATIITGDESWFYLEHPHQSVWPSSRDEAPERLKRKIDTKQCFMSVIWPVNGIHSLLDVPKKTTYNITFFSDVVFPDFIENICAGIRRRTPKRITMHLDNAHPHNSRKSDECLTEFRAPRVPHAAYSRDPAPNDFFLFGTVKAELQNDEIHSREDLILARTAIFGQISTETFISIYVSGIEKLKWVIKNGGEDFHK